jgi:4-hydroxy-tetrahydrodipicolinate reductase
MIKLAICGAGGRMGRAVFDAASKAKGVQVSGLLEKAGSPHVGKTFNDIPITARLEDLLPCSDVFIDFTAPESTAQTAAALAAAGKALVVGTTGLTGPLLEKFNASVKNIPVVLSPNMSLSANVLFDVAERLARLLPDYDAEIVEIHHNLKKDAPSGTAKGLAEAIARGRDGKSKFVHGRDGLPGERKPEEIGVHAVRGGDVVGDHTALFLGRGERIELVHRVTSREAFAHGAVAAALWLAGKKPGLYDMRDVLGLKSAPSKTAGPA